MPERDDETGRYTANNTTEDFIHAIEELGGAAGTQEIADEVGCEYTTAYSKLRKMEDDGSIDSRKVANARLWSVAEE